ncbi:unnamed protein product [Mytilus edulis]|uniref:SEA domain-containing protein n=1 Tax=Mytilus edulis TaxID=6550 RepID=A0A8S3SGW5_MYTED|nr:unnamed protein product [Mytilus edulis]
MSPKERYLRSVYLNYQVCTDVVRHYFDGLHPPTSLVQYLLDQRTKFEKEEKKIPNYQWVQLYQKVLFRADVHIKETDLKDYKEFTDRISTIFTCLFDTVDGDQKVKVVNLSRLESGEVLAKLEITSQYNPDDRKIRPALEVPVNSGNVDASLETSTDGFTFSQQGGNNDFRIRILFRADVHIKETYLASYDRTHTKDYKEFTDRISTIFTCLFDTVEGDQKVKVVNLSRLESGEVLAKLEITSQYNPDDRIIQQALKYPEQ